MTHETQMIATMLLGLYFIYFIAKRVRFSMARIRGVDNISGGWLCWYLFSAVFVTFIGVLPVGVHLIGGVVNDPVWQAYFITDGVLSWTYVVYPLAFVAIAVIAGWVDQRSEEMSRAEPILSTVRLPKRQLKTS